MHHSNYTDRLMHFEWHAMHCCGWRRTQEICGSLYADISRKTKTDQSLLGGGPSSEAEGSIALSSASCLGSG